MITYNDGSTLHNDNLERARTDVRVLGNLGIVNAELLLNLNGESSASFDIRGTFIATLVVEGSDDGVNYISVPFYNSVTEAWATTATAAGNFDVPNIASFRIIRVRCSAFTSGVVVTTLNASLGISMLYAKPLPTSLSYTLTAALSAAVAATVPAGGVGLFHYITRVRISKFCGAALTPAATPVIVTSTNVPNTPSFDFKNLGAQGDIEVLDLDFTGNPLKSAASNTNTVFTAPVLTGAIWKITVFYYLGA